MLLYYSIKRILTLIIFRMLDGVVSNSKFLSWKQKTNITFPFDNYQTIERLNLHAVQATGKLNFCANKMRWKLALAFLCIQKLILFFTFGMCIIRRL